MYGNLQDDKRAVKVSHLAILSSMLVVWSLVALLLSIVSEAGQNGAGGIVIASFFLNLLFGLVCLVVETLRRPFSLMQAHWVFYLTFLVIAPLSQFLFGYSCWGYALTKNDYIRTNLLLLLWGALVMASSAVATKARANKDLAFDEFYDAYPEVSLSAVNALLSISALATLMVVRVVGFENLFSRATYSTGMVHVWLCFLFLCDAACVQAFQHLRIWSFRHVGQKSVTQSSLGKTLRASATVHAIEGGW